VAYNAVCFLHKLVQILDTENVGLDRPPIVRAQYLVEYGGDVHGGGGNAEAWWYR
jgi:hypothetical protein